MALDENGEETAITPENSREVSGKYDHKAGGRAYFW